jgi:Taurine catabolism dioxygenase TauD, TfdA family
MGIAQRLALRSWIEHGMDAEAAAAAAREAVAAESIAFVRGFPPERLALAELGATFGEVMRKYRDAGPELEERIGQVQLRGDLPEEERLDTQGSAELHPHTANAWGVRRPRIFGLLMVDQGWIDAPVGMRGESIFVAVRDAIEELARLFPDTFEEDLSLLVGTPVEFHGNAVSRRGGTPVARMPLLFPVDDGGELGVRYREGMLETLRALVGTIEGGERYLEAVERFDQALETASRVELPLRPGELVLIDNRRVTHARRPFVAERPDGDGVAYNPRLLYSVHAGPEQFA